MKKETKNWALDDSRLPTNENLKRTPPDEAFLESIKEVQLQPIGMGHKEDGTWTLMFGRKRLLALRMLYERGEGKNCIWVSIFEPVTQDQISYFTLQENNFRSPNPISDALAIIEIMERDHNITPSELGNKIGMTATEVKKTYNEFGMYPKWILTGFLEGTIALSTGRKFIHLGKDVQASLKKKFNKEKKLTGTMVDEARRIMQTAQYVSIVPADVFNVNGFQRLSFARTELEPLLNLDPEQCKMKLQTLLS
jgi:hypothetical protein